MKDQKPSKLKRGHIREDGMVFWAYAKGCKNDENWVTSAKFTEKKERCAASERKPERKASKSESDRKRNATPKRKSEMADRYKNPESKKYWAEYQKKYNSTPEAKAKARERARKRRDDDNFRKYQNEYRKKRRSKDPLYALIIRIRSRTGSAFRVSGYSKASRTAKLIGCSWEFLCAHIESQFTKGMNWKNRHLWHVDHIVPLSSADTEERLIRLCHFSNLRPLWASDNISKKAKIITCQPELALCHH
jgi:hypothetical protein